jgi:hypothetical protein
LSNGRVKDIYLKNENVAPIRIDDSGKFDQAWKSKAMKDPFWPRLWPDKLDEIYRRKKPIGLYLSSMSDWADERIPVMWKKEMFDCIEKNPHHYYYLLSKCHDQVPLYKYIDSCRVGLTVTDQETMKSATKALQQTEAMHKYIIVEPMLESVVYPNFIKDLVKSKVEMVVVGAVSGMLGQLYETISEHKGLSVMDYVGYRVTAQPSHELITRLILSVLSAGIRIYLKDTLAPNLYVVPGMKYSEKQYWIVNGENVLRKDNWVGM